MKKIKLAIMLLLLLSSTGCFRRWVDPVVQYPIIPMEAYPDYKIPESLDTDKQKSQLVDALFRAEKYGMSLRSKVEIYNRFARNKNIKAKDLFK